MQDLTIPIEDDVLAAAEAVARKHKVTVGDLVRDYLVRVGQESRTTEARKALLELMDSTTGRLDAGFKWNREDVYAERLEPLLSRHKRSDLRSSSKS